jgi:hypothetical protein
VCPENDCNDTFKSSPELREHLWTFHQIHTTETIFKTTKPDEVNKKKQSTNFKVLFIG